ncbi:MAG: GNAT family N-acetyltransferase [Pseudomonadota bacterium]
MQFARQIQTKRLLLRPVCARDFWFFCSLVGNSEVRRHLGGPVHWTDWYSRFRRYLSPSAEVGVWVVVSVERGRAIGLVEMGPHKDGQDYEVSYQFHPTAWGRGFASEAVGAAISDALRGGRLERIIAETQSANTVSCRLLKGLGMVETQRITRFGAEQILFATK